MTMTLIETKTLGAAAASIEFTSIPQDGTDLVVVASLRNAADSVGLRIRLNGDTGTNFTSRNLQGLGSTVSSNTSSLAHFLLAGVGASTETANTFANTFCYFPNYTGSTTKSISAETVTENNATQAFQQLFAGLWNNTASITTLLFFTSGADFVAGSTVSLYKITKGTDGIVTTS